MLRQMYQNKRDRQQLQNKTQILLLLVPDWLLHTDLSEEPDEDVSHIYIPFWRAVSCDRETEMKHHGQELSENSHSN